MAYTIIKSDGTILTTIDDGTINTTSTSLGLMGRNFAGYGQAVDTNFVHQLENFAAASPPPYPIRGQLWYNINNNTLYVCPIDGETNAANWLALTSTTSGGTTTFGSINVQGNLQANVITAINSVTASDGIFTGLTISGTATIANANVTSANIGTITTTAITTGSAITPGTLTGTWSVSGTSGGNAVIVNNGNIYAAVGIKVNPSNFYDLTGNVISIGYGNANVEQFLPAYIGQVGNGATTFRGTTLTTGGNTTAGTITGNWSLSDGSLLSATYASVANIANTAATVTTNAQPNITSIGTLTGLNVSGNVTSNSNLVVNAIDGLGVLLNTSAGAPVGQLTNNGNSALALSATVSTLQLYANTSLMASFVDSGVNRLVTVDANLTATGNISTAANLLVGNSLLVSGPNNNSKVTAGIFQSTSGSVVAPSSPGSTTIFTVDTSANPISKWLITIMPGFAVSGGDINLLNGLTATFELAATQNTGSGPTYTFSKLTNNTTYVNLECTTTTTTLTVKVFNTLSGIDTGDWLVTWSAMRLI